MAQPIYCDWEGCDDHADMILSTLDPNNAETSAWCGPHWGQFVLVLADAARNETAPDAPAASDEPPPADESAGDQAAIDAATERLGTVRTIQTADGPLEVVSDGTEASEATVAALVAGQAAIDADTERLESFGLTPTEAELVLAAEADVEQQAAAALQAGPAALGTESPPDEASAAPAGAGEPTEGIEQPGPASGGNPGSPGPAGVEPANVVERGTSRGRRAHEARKREREQQQREARP